MNTKEEYVLINKTLWLEITNELSQLKKEIVALESSTNPNKVVYNNKDIRKLLGVNDKLIRKYRENGLLDYSYEGGKYWYSRDKIEKFLKNNRFS